MHTPQLNTWLIHCDGTALPNPGCMAIGAVLVAPDGTRHVLSASTGKQGCNNEAEARALIGALEKLITLIDRAADAHLHIHSDSSVLVAQLGSSAVAPIARLAHVFDAARALLNGFAQFKMQWIPRYRNTEADALARAALGLPSKAALKPRIVKRYAR